MSILTSRNINVKTLQSKSYVRLEWSDGFSSSFHYTWLRHNCGSFIDTYSGGREISPIHFPRAIHPKTVEINNNNQLEILWSHDNHLSQFDLSWLRKHSYSNKKDHQPRRKPLLWDGTFDKTICEADYETLFTDEEVQRNWLTAFRNYGFAKIKNVPSQRKIVLEIAKKLSYITYTNWGSFFDVIGGTEKTNYLGYTNKALSPHVDDASFNPVPTVQILHCMVNETEGGESTLVDGFKVADTLRKRAPEQFKLLSGMPIKFSWKPGDFPYEAEAPLIRINESGELEQIYFSNHTAQPFKFPFEIMEDYYKAYRIYSEMAESDKFQIRFRFKPGDLNMIDNHRILHGRTAFSAEGKRHLQGCYLARDGLYSRLAMLNNKLSFQGQ